MRKWWRYGAGPGLVLLILPCSIQAQDQPWFTRIEPVGIREMLLELSVPAGHYYRIEVSPDLAQWVSLASALSSGDIDVAFLCMRGPPPNMTIPEVLQAVRAFAPKVVYPYHYTTNHVGVFKQQLSIDSGIEVRLRDWY